ncbi:MAG TPA: hypothetical protein VF843_15605 [Streptosporangiaceae bacterium]
MSVTKVVRYTTKPEAAEENVRLIREVFAELAAQGPAGLRYAAFRLDDGVSFVHVATLADEGSNPLAASEAFAKFQRDIGSRCVQAPAAADATIVGSYQAAAG